VELFYFFEQINMYVNFAARTDLVRGVLALHIARRC
jgi:hypothetical protein